MPLPCPFCRETAGSRGRWRTRQPRPMAHGRGTSGPETRLPRLHGASRRPHGDQIPLRADPVEPDPPHQGTTVPAVRHRFGAHHDHQNAVARLVGDSQPARPDASGPGPELGCLPPVQETARGNGPVRPIVPYTGEAPAAPPPGIRGTHPGRRGSHAPHPPHPTLSQKLQPRQNEKRGGTPAFPRPNRPSSRKTWSPPGLRPLLTPIRGIAALTRHNNRFSTNHRFLAKAVVCGMAFGSRRWVVATSWGRAPGVRKEASVSRKTSRKCLVRGVTRGVVSMPAGKGVAAMPWAWAANRCWSVINDLRDMSLLVYLWRFLVGVRLVRRQNLHSRRSKLVVLVMGGGRGRIRVESPPIRRRSVGCCRSIA